MDAQKTTVSPEVKKVYETLVNNQQIKKALEFIEKDHHQTVKEQIEITEIPAPPFKEKERAEDYMNRLKELALKDVQMDSEGNVFGIRKGHGKGPKIFISAHLDTVFPEGTDTTVKQKDGILYAPGVGDDTRGLAELLSIIRTFNELDIKNSGDIIFGATVGEEGAGDLRGVKAFFNERNDIDAFISLDGPRPNYIVYLATGSFRFDITYKGPGGHSFGAFGLPSATHALGRAIAKIAEIKTPAEPRTTYTVGKVSGGTSVNAIAEEANMQVDLRSNNHEELVKLEAEFLSIVEQAATEENRRWNSDKLTVNIKKVGVRPAATQSKDIVIVQAAWSALKVLGEEPHLSSASSTDSNHPMSLGIPSITLGRGGSGGKSHTLEEWHNPQNGHIGIQKSFLTLIGLIGVENITEPLMNKKE